MPANNIHSASEELEEHNNWVRQWMCRRMRAMNEPSTPTPAQPSAPTPDQASAQPVLVEPKLTPKPRKQGWIVVYQRPQGYVFEATPYTTSSQSQALANATKELKSSLTDTVRQVNYYLNEIAGQQQRIKMLGSLCPDDTLVPEIPAATSESRASEPSVQAIAQAQPVFGTPSTSYFEVHYPGGTHPPETPVPRNPDGTVYWTDMVTRRTVTEGSPRDDSIPW